MATEMEVIHVANRVCDLCDQPVTSTDHEVTRSFVLTDWGVICIRCWDDKIEYHRDFEVVKIYIPSQRVDDDWISRPIGFVCLDPD